MFKTVIMKKVLPLLFLTGLAFSCTNETDPGLGQADYVVFGIAFGECIGDCITIFRVSELRLEEDTNSQYLTNDFQFVPSRVLNDSQLNEARKLLHSIPGDLMQNPADRYGCPDCRDQGGIYIQYKIQGELKKVVIDPDDTDDQSQAIISFKEEVLTLIEAFRD